MSKAPKGVKLALLLLTGAVLLSSFATFTYLFFRYERGDDPNNEDLISARAEEAKRNGDPVTAAALYTRLMALNPFERSYESAYLHALVEMRDFETLASATNTAKVSFALTDVEKKVEAALAHGVTLSNAASNELAIAAFASVTNLNFFAATPFLIQAHAKAGDYARALTLARAYTARFPHPYVLRQAIEWSALARRADLINDCRARALRIHGRSGIALACYCDALTAWLGEDLENLARAMNTLNGAIETPLARLMKLRAAAYNGTAKAVEAAYDETVADVAPDTRIAELARATVKAFLAERFPGKITIDEIERLTALILVPENPDADVLRLSLLAKATRGALLPQELDAALRRFPNDRGLLLIRAQQRGK